MFVALSSFRRQSQYWAVKPAWWTTVGRYCTVHNVQPTTLTTVTVTYSLYSIITDGRCNGPRIHSCLLTARASSQRPTDRPTVQNRSQIFRQLTDQCVAAGWAALVNDDCFINVLRAFVCQRLIQLLSAPQSITPQSCNFPVDIFSSNH